MLWVRFLKDDLMGFFSKSCLIPVVENREDMRSGASSELISRDDTLHAC